MSDGFRLGDLLYLSTEAVQAIAGAAVFVALFWSIAWTNSESKDMCEALDSYIIRESPMDKERKDKLDSAYSQCIIRQAEVKHYAHRRPAH